MNRSTVLLLLLASVLVSFGLSLLIRRVFFKSGPIDSGHWSATLSYVATAYGIVLGFSIIFLFGEFSDARQAVGDEATSIGTAFEEARLFPEAAPEIHHALLCYAKAVPQYEWPAMERRTSAPEVDVAYRKLIESLGPDEQGATSTFQPAVATNIVLQIGNISTARETRLVAAETQVPVLLWILLIGGGAFVIVMLFVVTLSARPLTQAALVSLSALFTTVMILIVVALSMPFTKAAGRVTPKLIEQTTTSMAREAPAAAARSCQLR